MCVLSGSRRGTRPTRGRFRRIRGACLAACRPVGRCERGNAALEFGLMAPVFLLILAAVVDLGLVLRGRFLLNTEVSSAAGYSVMQGGDATDGRDFAELIARQLQAGRIEHAEVVVNNAGSAKLEDGAVTSDDGPGSLRSCYCPEGPPDGALEWNKADCSTQCPDRAAAGRYVQITASTSHSSMFGRYVFTGDTLLVHTLARID